MNAEQGNFMAPGGTEAPTGRLASAWQRFTHRPLATLGALVVAIFVLIALLAPILAPVEPTKTDWGAIRKAPSTEHPFGTDELGRDNLSRVIWGTRSSMQAGVMSILFAMLLGVPLGLVSGFYRGWADQIIMRITDAWLSFPFLILAIGIVSILGPSLTNASIAIGLGATPAFVRLTRGQVLGVREEDFVQSARAVGAGDTRILARCILPNIFSPLLVLATVSIPGAIIAESILSFLGLGVQPPNPSWGTMLNSAQDFLDTAPWMAIYPGVSIFLVAFAFNLAGDGLRDMLDPKDY